MEKASKSWQKQKKQPDCLLRTRLRYSPRAGTKEEREVCVSFYFGVTVCLSQNARGSKFSRLTILPLAGQTDGKTQTGEEGEAESSLKYAHPRSTAAPVL